MLIIENAWVRLTVSPDGALNLYDKSRQYSYTQNGVFEDGGDAGDTYNYSFPLHDIELPPAISPADIAGEETRAAELEARLAQQESAIQEAVTREEPESLTLSQLRLDAATTRRALLEARLSANLLKKNLWQTQQTQGAQGTEAQAAQFGTMLRQIGDAINIARVEKRALEYVVDYYAKQ